MSKLSYSIIIAAISATFWSGCLDEDLDLSDVVCGALASCINGVGETIVYEDEKTATKCFCKCDPGFCGFRCEKNAPVCPEGHVLNEFDCECEDISLLPGATSQIRLENRSNSRVSYDVLIDGEWMSSLAPGGESELIEVKAGKHHLEFRVSGTATPACINEEISLLPGQRKRFVCDI